MTTIVFSEENFYSKNGKKTLYAGNLLKDDIRAIVFQEDLGDVYVEENIKLPIKTKVGTGTHVHALDGIEDSRTAVVYYGETRLIDADFHKKKEIEIRGSLTVSHLFVSNNLEIDGNIMVDNFISVRENAILEIHGQCRLGGEFGIQNGIARFYDSLFCKTLRLSGEICEFEMSGDLSVENDLKILVDDGEFIMNGTVTCGELYSNSGIIIEGDLYAKQINIKDEIQISGKCNISGNAIIDDGLYAEESIKISGDLRAEMTVESRKDLVVGGLIEYPTEIKAGRDIRAKKSIKCGGLYAGRNIVSGGEIKVDGDVVAGNNILADFSIEANKIGAELRIFAGLFKGRKLSRNENTITAFECSGQIASGVFVGKRKTIPKEP